MKDFTKYEYIEPIINIYRALYTPIKDKSVLNALHCDVLLQSNHSRNAIAVRHDDCFYGSTGTKDLFAEVAEYAESASTYDGELSDWEWQEKDRIQLAIRDRLIEVFA